jgi:hypothetical protein
MATVNDKELEDLLGKCSAWIPKAMEQVGCLAPVDVTSTACKKAMKDTLALLFAESFHYVRFQTEKVKQLKAELSSTKSKLIENQQWVISLQEQLIDCKDKQLEGVETVVKTSVESNLKEQFKSYSEAAAENVMVCSTDGLADQKTLKKVVKSVVEEEDRSRNVIIFGLPEEKQEIVCERVQDIFKEIGLKPTLQASRVGKTAKENANRPVKVSLSNASTVYQILSQARKLRHSAKFSKVFVRPDRSEEERASDRLLVQELSQRRKNEPNRLHYIRSGTVCSKDKGAD